MSDNGNSMMENLFKRLNFVITIPYLIFFKYARTVQNLQQYFPHINSLLPTYGWVEDFDNFEALETRLMVDIQCLGYGNW